MTGVFVALAGGLGAGTRYVLDSTLSPRLPAHLPLATLIINVIGSFLLGLLVGSSVAPGARLILGIGFLGGFTTFSAASVESVRLVFARRPSAAAGLLAMMLGGSVLAAACGYLLGRALAG